MLLRELVLQGLHGILIACLGPLNYEGDQIYDKRMTRKTAKASVKHMTHKIENDWRQIVRFLLL